MVLPVPVAGDTGHVAAHDTIAGILNDPATNWPQGNATYVAPTGKTTSSATAAAPLPWVNPIDKGAKFDGVTDDTAALQAAIDSGYCDLPPGTAKFTTLTYPSGCRIRGAGFGKTILSQITGTAQPMLAPAAATGLLKCRMEGFSLASGANAVGTGGLVVQGVQQSYFDVSVESYVPVALLIKGGTAGGDAMHNVIRGRVNNFYPGAVLVDVQTTAASTPDGTDIDIELQEAGGTNCTLIRARGTGPNYYGPSGCRVKVRGYSSSACTALDWEGNSTTFDGRIEAAGNILVTYTANSLGDNITRWMLSPVGGALTFTDNSAANPNLQQDSVVNGATITRTTRFGHLRGAGAAPALSGANAHIASSSISGTDTAGLITLNTDGTGVGAFNTLITVTFSKAFAATPVVILTPQSAAGAGQWQAFNVSTTSFQLTTTGSLGASTAYPVGYFAVQP